MSINNLNFSITDSKMAIKALINDLKQCIVYYERGVPCKKYTIKTSSQEQELDLNSALEMIVLSKAILRKWGENEHHLNALLKVAENYVKEAKNG